MNYIWNYFRNRAANKREISKQDRIYMLLASKCYHEKLYEKLPKFDFSINRKEEIEYDIQSIYGWERTPNGFEFRNNFRLAEDGKDISFDRYSIIKSNDTFESDGSKISDDFIKNNSKILKSLMKIYQVYDALSKQYESDVEEELSLIKKRLELFGGNFSLDEKANSDCWHIAMYYHVHGNLGKNMLIKWLNQLSDPQKSMNELLVEFTNDINDINIYYKEYLDEKYSKNYKFEYVLLAELMQYSPRGKILREMYKDLKKEKLTSRNKAKFN